MNRDMVRLVYGTRYNPLQDGIQVAWGPNSRRVSIEGAANIHIQLLVVRKASRRALNRHVLWVRLAFCVWYIHTKQAREEGRKVSKLTVVTGERRPTDASCYVLTTNHRPERAFLVTIFTLGSNLGVLFLHKNSLQHVIFHLLNSQSSLFPRDVLVLAVAVGNVCFQTDPYTPETLPGKTL
jgi:hypothetical protein